MSPVGWPAASPPGYIRRARPAEPRRCTGVAGRSDVSIAPVPGEERIGLVALREVGRKDHLEEAAAREERAVGEQART